MKKHFTIKSVLIALLAMISCTMKAEIVEYTTDGGFAYSLDTETQEASLDKYSGEATEVVIPESVTYEGNDYKVTSLGEDCFQWCSSLTSLEIPSSVISLGRGCFCYCSSLTSLEIPSSVISLGRGCFYYCSSLESIVVDANNPVYDSREGCNAIIETKQNTMMAGCKSTRIPSSVTSLGNSCFSGCSSLMSVEIPSSVTSLGDYCFSDCSSLTSIEIPSSVTSLGNYCFSGCSSLTSVDIPSSVTSLGDYCFHYCSSLTSVDIPSSVTSLGDWCFHNCSSLTSIELPSSVTSLRGSCFAYCPSLESIVVDATNPVYDSREGCNAIIERGSNTMIAGCKSTRIPLSVTSLGDNCFSGCSSLMSVEIPSSVTSLGDYCFYNCSSLMSVEIPSSVTSLGDYCFYNCSSLASIEIPSSVTSLGIYSFYNCFSLTSVEIPSSVTTLGYACFYNCFSLTSVEIPSSVTTLREDCFYRCYSLKTVICKMETIERNDFFRYTPIADATLYVPEELLYTYKSTAPWSGFGIILPLTDEQVSVDDTPELGIALKTNNGNVVVSGLVDSTPVSCYTLDGRMLGKASANDGTATFTAEPNSVVIVEVGKKSFKVYVK